MKIKAFAAAAACAVATSGCASIIRGTSQDFGVESTPPGAQAALSTGETCVTPCSLRRSRNEAFSVTVSLEGYNTSTHQILNPWSRNGTTTGIVGNAILGGGIGIGVDAMTGANRDLTPNPLVVTLEPDATPLVAAVAAPEPELAAAEPTSALGPPPEPAPADAAAPAETTPAAP